MTNENNGVLEVLENLEGLKGEEAKDLTPEQQKALAKKKEKEMKKLENYSKSMISRGEAYQMAKSVAVEEVGHLANFLREPLRANIMQTMAVVELLKAKGIIESDEEFQKYLDIVADKLKEEEGNGEEGIDEGIYEDATQETKE